MIFEQFYRAEQRAPWDLDRPTPFVADLEAAGAFQGDILDAGCGTGENALFLAARSHTVVGIDSAPTAIARARLKAVQRHLSVTFVEADACELPGYVQAFDTVLDCGFFHVLAGQDQQRYVAALNRATRPGATLHLMAFSDRNPLRTEQRPVGCFTHGVSEKELREAFAPLWSVAALKEVPANLQGREVHFWQACLTKKGASHA